MGKSKEIKCPHCDGSLTLCQDAIIYRKIGKSPNKKIDIGYLDDIWVECKKCCITSEDDPVLKYILKYILDNPE